MRIVLILVLLVSGFAHAALEVVGGSTSQLIVVKLYAADGTAKTGLVYGDMTITYTRNNAAAAADVTEDTMTMGTWASGGFIEVDATSSPGLYQFGIPNAALAAGANEVTLNFKATGVVPYAKTISIIAVDFRASANVSANMIQVEGADATDTLDARLTAYGALKPTTAGRTLDVTATGEAGVDLNNVAGTLDAAEIGADAITAAKIAAAAITASEAPNLDAAVSSRLATAGYTAPLDAAGTRTALGLASANLDTQLDTLPTAAEIKTAMEAVGSHLALILEDTGTSLPATLSALATAAALTAHDGKLDTVDGIVDDILVIADKLDAMLELDGAVYRYTANALELGPGGGSGGDATAENQTTILDRLAGLMSKDHALGTAVGTFDPATDSNEAIRDRGDAAWLSGAGEGAITYTYTLTSTVGGTPIDDALVEVFTESAMTNKVAQGRTDAFGVATFYLDAGTYYLRRTKSGYNFNNPQTVTVAE